METEFQHKKKITLTREQMKQLARYEITFKDLCNGIPLESYGIICPEVYTYTLDDLTHALKNMRRSDPTVGEFGDYWYYPINAMDVEWDLCRARGLLLDEDDRPEALKIYQGLSLSDSAQFDSVWWEFEFAWNDYGDEEALVTALDIDSLLKDLKRYQMNKNKPIEEWVFSNQEKKAYLYMLDNDKAMESASEQELALLRRFVEDLCTLENEQALRMKGYACYGGNRLYECDWHASRDCMLKLFELTDNPTYANTLGYIFYYGRCTGGEPEYDKAFYYFGISAANGLYEGMYKLADMFHHGYGCKQSNHTARRLYQMVYDDAYKNFLNGSHANFADVALRMGNVYAKGIGEHPYYELAYVYYLQANYAAKLRAKTSDFFGDIKVVRNTQDAIDSIKEKLPSDYFKDHMDHNMPYDLIKLTEKNHRCVLTRSDNKDGCVKLTAKRMKTMSCPEPDSVLITHGPLQYCKRTIEVSMTAVNTERIIFEGASDQVHFDYCCWNDEEECCEFYYDEELTAVIKCETFRVFKED